MDIYDFLEYFKEKFDLRQNIIYNDDCSIVCNILEDSNYSARTIVSIKNPNNISIEEANEYCNTIQKYITTHSKMDLFELYKNNCSVQNFYDYLKYINFRLDLRNISKAAPIGVDQEVYEEALTKYLVDYRNANENEIKTTVFGYKNDFPSDYEEVCLLTEMKFIGTKYGLSSIAYRTRMSYSNGFKYKHLFTPSNSICKLLKNTLSEYPSIIKKVWIYNNDKNILLISMSGYNFLTTIDMLLNDLNMTKTEFNNYIQNN